MNKNWRDVCLLPLRLQTAGTTKHQIDLYMYNVVALEIVKGLPFQPKQSLSQMLVATKRTYAKSSPCDVIVQAHY